MRFIVSRTSTWDSGPERPCDEAYYEVFTEVQKHTREPAEKFLACDNSRKFWISDGSNHRTEDGYAVRDMDIYTWFVDIESLDDLRDFIAKYGNVVIVTLKSGRHAGMMAVEIYDGWRE